MAKVVKFYAEHNIDYFLFAPHFTCIGIRPANSRICVGASVTYENGAIVSTSFVSPKGPLIRSAPDLYRMLDEANVANIKAKEAPSRPVYTYPDNVMTSSAVALFSKYGIEYREDIGVFVRAMDAQRGAGKAIFGAGLHCARGGSAQGTGGSTQGTERKVTALGTFDARACCAKGGRGSREAIKKDVLI